MEGIGKIKDISRSMAGGFTIVMEVADMKLEELKKLCGCERLTISLKRYREKRTLEADTYHIRPTAQIKPGKDGVNYRAYIMRRGSSTYDKKEMSMLIDGLVSDCMEMGIETLPSGELERMMSVYEQKHSDRVL